jgi:hypothetical protein
MAVKEPTPEDVASLTCPIAPYLLVRHEIRAIEVSAAGNGRVALLTFLGI